MLVILCGKSASGKDTTQKELVDRGLIPLVSTTDRPMRDGETEGVEYYFKTKEEFTRLVDENKFIEYRAYETKKNGKKDIFRYGTEKFDLDTNKDYVTIKDLSCAKLLKEMYGDEAIIFFFNVPDEVRRSRCEKRGDLDESEWNRRLKADEHDFPLLKLLFDRDVTVLHYMMMEHEQANEYTAGDFADYIYCLIKSPIHVKKTV